jgi:hypothetical protein
MARKTALRSVASVAAVAIVAHLVWSTAMVELLAVSYDHRIFDVRRWPWDLQAPAKAQLVAAFTDDRLDRSEGQVTVFLGSSFTFGYAWQEGAVLSRRYAALRPAETVLNVSVIGAGLQDLNRVVLCGVRNARQRIDIAVLEIPVINAVSRIAQQQESVHGENGCAPDRRTVRYLRFSLLRPIGVGWIPFIWDPYAYDKHDEDVVLVPVPQGYFVRTAAYNRIREDYREFIAATVVEAKPIAQRLVVFPSPVYLPGAAHLGEDDAAIGAQLADAVSACRAIDGVTCLDPAMFYGRRDIYYNMTHLNQRGHQVIAEWLDAALPR